jgi:hypothetical protein
MNFENVLVNDEFTRKKIAGVADDIESGSDSVGKIYLQGK